MNYREICFRHYDRRCWACGSDSNIQVHHIRGTTSPDTIDNLVPLCASCHRRVHSDTARSGRIGKLQGILWEHDPKLPDVDTAGNLQWNGEQLVYEI